MTGSELKKPLLTKLNRLSELASKDPRLKFTSLAHLLDEVCLTESYWELNRYATYGIDQVD